MVKLPEGLEVYRERIDQLLSWLPLEVHEFDKQCRANPAPIVAFEPGTYIIGIDRGVDTELMGHLVHLGYVFCDPTKGFSYVYRKKETTV
jgi:hypothetical protein